MPNGRDCSAILPYVPVTVLERRPYFARVNVQAQGVDLNVWVNAASLECKTASQSTKEPVWVPAPPRPEAEITGDGFVWLNGKRVGYVDPRGPTFYRLEQMDLGGAQGPLPKSGELGLRLEDHNQAAQIDKYLRSPKDFVKQGSRLERTGDGFVWRDGKRLGWVTGTAFYPMSALVIIGDNVKPKHGQKGIEIVSGDVDAAVAEAERRGDE